MTLLNLGKTTTTLLPEEGTLIQLETPVFLHLIDTHVIQVKDTSQSPTMALSAEVHRLLIEAGDEALEVANQRYLLVEAYQNKQQEIYAGTPTRTIRDWLTNFRDAEAAYSYGYGYVGLLPKTAARGNREPKVTEERRRLLDEAIAQWYNCASHHGCGFPWRKRAFSSVFLLSLRERCATRRRLLKESTKGGSGCSLSSKTSPFFLTFIVSPPVYSHNAFLDDFFWRPLPYTQVEATPLWRTCGESSPLSKKTSRVGAQKAHASAGVCQTLVVRERSHREMKGEEMLWMITKEGNV